MKEVIISLKCGWSMPAHLCDSGVCEMKTVYYGVIVPVELELEVAVSLVM